MLYVSGKMKDRHRYNRYISAVALSIVFCFLLSSSWMKWGDIIVDTFRDFWIAQQILAGKVIYRDLFYEYGILPPYLLALLFKIFGVSFYTIAGCGIVVAGGMVHIMYRLSRFFCNRKVSVLISICFMTAFAFQSTLFNFLMPYSFAATLFSLFTATALFLVMKSVASGKKKYLYAGALCFSGAFLSRIEMSMVVWIGLMSVWLLYSYKTQKKIDLLGVTILTLPLVISATAYGLFFVTTSAFEGFSSCVTRLATTLVSDNFQMWVSGFSDVRGNCFTMFAAFVQYIFLVLGTYGVFHFVFVKRNAYFVGVAIILCCGIDGMIINRFQLFRSQYSIMPVLILVVFLMASIGCLFKNGKRDFPLLILSTIAGVLIVRIPLNINSSSYAFYLAPVGLICYFLFFFRILAATLEKIIPRFSSSAWSVSLLIVFTLSAGIQWSYKRNVFNAKNRKVVTAFGKYMTRPDVKIDRLEYCCRYLRENTPAHASLVVLPEGIIVNILSFRDNPTGYCNFTPPIFSSFGVQKIIGMFAEKKIDYFVVLQREAWEYGTPRFGVDYAQELDTWIRTRYTLLGTIGNYPFTSHEFGIAVWKRN